MDGSGRYFFGGDRMKIEDMQTNTTLAHLTQLQLTSPTRSALSSFLSTVAVEVEEKLKTSSILLRERVRCSRRRGKGNPVTLMASCTLTS